ncbi:MAG TPA: hypothetical protein VGQ55_14565 [Pyrinomonadaceae bacterium]|jgi:hypothetical protein|nr:hypothetical protein [Pyrinomonadaceae bacterium]
MNDDLHKTFEPEPVPEDPVKAPAPTGGGWKMPSPVFRRSDGRSANAPSGGTINAPTTIVPARLAKKEAAPAPAEAPPPPEIEAQPLVPDPPPHENLDFSDLRATKPARSRLAIGIAVAVLVSIIGIVLVMLVAALLGYIVWFQ